ncbi:MAG: type II secretion system protein [Planctomycetota bacterium]
MDTNVNFSRRRRHRPGFTLVEIIVVIAVIAILTVILITAISGSIQRAKKTTAMNNLRDCRIMLQQYSTKMGLVYDFPPRLTYLSTRFGFSREPGVYLDPADPAHGTNGPFPASWDTTKAGSNPFPTNTDWYNHDLGEGTPSAPADTLPCSFIYEFADVPSSDQADMISWMYNSPSSSQWDLNGDGQIAWREYKMYQIHHGDAYSNGYGVSHYPESLFPILRSAWWSNFDYQNATNIDFEQLDPNTPGSLADVMCESLEGEYFETTKFWEAYVLTHMGKPVPPSDLLGN